MTSCAGDNTIAALLAGAIDPTAVRQLDVHLDGCAACRQMIADLGRGLGALDPGAGAGLPRAGELFGRYEIRRVIGVGGMGVVYEARDTRLDRRVALKLLRPDSTLDPHALVAEARAMARLSHRNVATVHDVGTTDGHRFLCMEYVAGSTLREWLAETPRTQREILRVYTDAGRGLAYIHGKGLVHLDFKPDNVLVERMGRVVVTDFGLSLMVGHAGAVAGTPAYMAPEQKRGGPSDARADQFAFCTALGEALGEAAPGHVRRAIARGRSARSEDRFASFDELLVALERSRARLAIAALAIGAVALVGASMAPGWRTVTRVVDRPVVQRVVEHAVGTGAGDRAEERTPAPAEPVAAAPLAGGVRVAEQPGNRETSVLWHALATDRQASEVGLVSTGALLAPHGATVEHDHICDDGSEQTCTAARPPWCPAGSTLALQEGCWTCADEHSCAQLGAPHLCDDGSPMRCTQPRPRCSGRELPSIRGGCWECADPFTCAARSPALPVLPPLPNRCGNGTCDPAESTATCAQDCAAPARGGGGETGRDAGVSSSGSDGGLVGGETFAGSDGGVGCGDGFCELGEDHASCPSDCCEAQHDGACVPLCGNGFCELGESHASCASDCL